VDRKLSSGRRALSFTVELPRAGLLLEPEAYVQRADSQPDEDIRPAARRRPQRIKRPSGAFRRERTSVPVVYSTYPPVANPTEPGPEAQDSGKFMFNPVVVLHSATLEHISITNTLAPPLQGGAKVVFVVWEFLA